MTNAIKDSVRGFIVENFLFGDATQVPDDNASLIENDIIDSTGVLELVAFIEDQFKITMADADIVPANLDSLDKIATYIAAHNANAAPMAAAG